MFLTRRRFLKSSGLALTSYAAMPPFLLRALGQTRADDRADQPIIIAIFQRGAADGISMVVPFGDTHYYSARPQIGIPEPRRDNNDGTIDLDGFFGLHPGLGALKPIYNEKHLAIVHAVGSPSNTRSHFDAQDYMESGAPDNKSIGDGWLNRYLQRKPQSDPSPFRAVAVSRNVPRCLNGRAPVVAMDRIADFGLRGGPAAQEYEAVFAEMYKATFDAVKLLKAANPERYSPDPGVQYPRSPFGQSLLQIAQLIKANIGLQIAFTDIGGWDTHANQGSARGQLALRLQDFGNGLAALYRDLGDRMQRVVIVTMTEFGRAIRQNGSGGTDHGHASCLFVAGGPVRGGKVYGRWPGLAPEQLFEGRDLAITTDFRDVLAAILQKHMHATDISPIFPRFKASPMDFLG
jgi:uncharacterized protein (DUF1501 family)